MSRVGCDYDCQILERVVHGLAIVILTKHIFGLISLAQLVCCSKYLRPQTSVM